MNYQRFFEAAVDQVHAERRYRVFADLERIAGAFPQAIKVPWLKPGMR